MRFFATVMLLFVMVSCKSKKVLTGGEIDTSLSAKSVIKTHYGNELDFKTLSGRMKIDYSDGDSEQGFGVSLRMEKDKTIWISAPLGVVKALVTPDRVSFYNKLQNEYFDGDFTYLSNLLGTDLDFEKVQNVLLGQALFDLRKEKHHFQTSNLGYELTPKDQHTLFKILYVLEPQNFKIATQQLSQPLKKRVLQINYENYGVVDGKIVPGNIAIEAADGKKNTDIKIEYKNLEFGRNLNFPYKIPKGYKKIELD